MMNLRRSSYAFLRSSGWPSTKRIARAGVAADVPVAERRAGALPGVALVLRSEGPLGVRPLRGLIRHVRIEPDGHRHRVKARLPAPVLGALAHQLDALGPLLCRDLFELEHVGDLVVVGLEHL